MATDVWKTSLNEIGSRWFSGLEPAAWVGVEVGLLGVGLASLLLLVRARATAWRLVSIAYALGVAGWSIHRALQQPWIADDAFISFRYARNFAEGNGLVWNVGERLEGYTNFLWTVLLAIGHLFGAEMAHTATAMTLGCLVALAVVGTWKLGRPGWVPLAPALLVLSPAFVEFGTSGLEAGPTAMCVGFAVLFLADPARRHLAGWWILVAALLRPDHALFFAPLGLLQLFAGRTAVRHTIAAGAGFGLYWLGRWAYFGELFPNTFHAKSGGGAYWEQGSLYFADFSLATGLWLAVPVVFVVALVLAIPQRKAREERLPWAALVFAFVGATVFGLYMARVGGDFMEFRFGLTSLVLFAFGADALLSRLAGERAWAMALAGLALLPLGLAPRLIKDGEKKWHIARESSFYKVKTWFPLEIDSGNWKLGLTLAGLPEAGAKVPPLAAGCIGMVGYLSRVNIIDRFGLTNAGIARKKIKERGRPGHEKYANTDELIAEGAQWSVDPLWEEPLAARTTFRLGNTNFWVLRHTPALSAALKLPEPRTVLTAVSSPEEARAQLESLSTLYADLPVELEAWRAKWDLVDARELEAEGPSVERGPNRISAKETLKLSVHKLCPSPNRLRWTVAKGSCAAAEARCVEGKLDAEVTCTGPEILLQNFVFEPIDLDVRIARARARGTEALANVVREADEIPGLVTRLGFDDAQELTREGFEQSAKIFDVTHKPAAGQGVITGMRGAGLLNGFAWGDAPTGRLRIAIPVEQGKPVLVSFLFAGGSACDRVSARVHDGDAQVMKVCAFQDEILRPSSIVITPRSDRLVLEVIDEDAKAWGHALLDDLLVWSLN